MAKVLITGATGFVGQRLVKAIDINKEQIVILTRRNISNFETIVCDLENDEIPKDALEGVDTIFHLAGIAHESIDSSKSYFSVNVKATEKLFKLAEINGVKQFIFLSSVKAIEFENNSCSKPIKNNNSSGIYGKTKREAELILLKLAKESKIHMTILRSSLVYGPSMKGNLGTMFLWIKNGWFPPLPKTSNQRSMIHVDDLVRALIFVSKTPEANGEIYTVTDGTPYSSRELYEIMCNIQGKKIPKWYIPRFVLYFVGYMLGNRVRKKIKKLLEDEYYSSEKITSIGFIPLRSLKEINETFF